jgi:hypothetical protein
LAALAVVGGLFVGCSGDDDGGLRGGAGGAAKAVDTAEGNAGTTTTVAPSTTTTAPPVESASKRLQPFTTVAGGISPKSVVASGHGEVFKVERRR